MVVWPVKTFCIFLQKGRTFFVTLRMLWVLNFIILQDHMLVSVRLLGRKLNSHTQPEKLSLS
jgi:hypothetical protein